MTKITEKAGMIEALAELKEYFKVLTTKDFASMFSATDCVIEIYGFKSFNAKIKKHIKEIFTSRGFDAIAKKEGYLLVR